MPEWNPELRTRLARLRLRPEREAEIVEELSQHLDQRYEELREAGSSDAEAQRMALEELREDDVLAEHMRSLRQSHTPPPVTSGEPSRSFLDGLWQDLRYALRSLRKQPGFALTATLTLALGIGANGAIFALVDATLLRPLPFAEPDQLVMLWERSDTSPQGPVAPANLVDWNERSRTFEQMGAYVPSVGQTVLAAEDGAADTIPRQWVTAGIFETIGITPVAGRLFGPLAESQQVNEVVLSESFWRARFAGDPAVVGTDIRLDGRPFTIVGVVPDSAKLIGDASIWAVWYLPAVPQLRTNYQVNAVGRMKPGVTVESASADLEAVADGLARELPDTNAGRGVALQPLRDVMIGSDVRLTSLLFLGVVGFVLLICCANVANLLLGRATTRMRELAVRSALGAGRGRLIRQLLTESLVLAALGGLLGAAIGWVILAVAPSIIPTGLLPAAVTLHFDLRVAAFCAVAAILIGVAFGLAPAWKSTGVAAARVIASNSRTATGEGHRLQGLLVVAEVSTAVLVLYGAGLLLRTLIAVGSIDHGYREGRVLTMMIDPLGSSYPTPELLLQFFDQVEQEIAAIPGVSSVAWSSNYPLRTSEENAFTFQVIGDPPEPLRARPPVETQVVSPDYFETLGLPLVAGRTFDERDTFGKPYVVIVGEAYARRYAQGRSPIGMRLALQELETQQPVAEAEIVGVARQVTSRPGQAQDLVQMYVPMAQRPLDDMFVLVGSSLDDPTALTRSVRMAVSHVDREQLVSVVGGETVDDMEWNASARHRFRAVLVTTLAGLALALAMVGVFGILAYSVQQRVREIGVRRALGATTGDVIRLVAGSAGRLIAVGVTVGLALAAVFGRLLATMLFGVEPLDAVTFAGVAVVLVVAAAVATVAPAWRAVHVEPASALRTD